MNRRLRSVGRWCAAALLVLPLAAGCDSASDDAGSDLWTQFDETFVAQMIPHHHLGMTLIDEATRRSGDVRLRHLVFQMNTYHMSDLSTLEAWADDRSIVTATTFPGALTANEVDSLANYEGTSHDIVWLDLMIRHHEGALVIADAEIAGGGVAAATEMAAETRRVQSAEIDTMKSLLGELCGESVDSAVESSCR